MIIDFHVHTFPEKIAAKTLEHLSSLSKTHYFSDGTTAGIQTHMKNNGISYSVNLPVSTSPSQVKKLNDSFIENLESLMEAGIIPFGAMHPEFENPAPELRRIKEAGIRGIKLHPAYQGVMFDDIRFKRIVSAAAQEGLIVTIHAGMDIGLPDKNYSDTASIINVLEETQVDKLVLAHMGGWGRWDDVLSDLAGLPLYLDTSFSIGEIHWKDKNIKHDVIEENMSPEFFSKLVKAHGTDRILFGTDSPWEAQRSGIESIKNAPSLSDSEKADILGNNAARLLGVS